MRAKDVFYHVGLFAGLIVGILTLRAAGLSGIFQILGSLAVGVGCGCLAERAFSGPTDLEVDGLEVYDLETNDFSTPADDDETYIQL